MKKVRLVPFLLCFFVLSSCYHAKITTEAEPSAKVYDIPFASSWINGLVPPKEVKAAQECTNGVAMVETRLSFVNMLVGFLTLGIYTPMHIKVTCAANSGMSSIGYETLNIPKNASSQAIVEAFTEAGEMAVKRGETVFVKFE